MTQSVREPIALHPNRVSQATTNLVRQATRTAAGQLGHVGVRQERVMAYSKWDVATKSPVFRTQVALDGVVVWDTEDGWDLEKLGTLLSPTERMRWGLLYGDLP